MNPLGQLPFPTQLAFEPVQLCNAKCFCCPYTWLSEEDSYRGVRMPRERIAELLDDFGGVRERHGYSGMLIVHPFRYSDPMLCKDLDLIFELAEKHKLNLVITTNGIGLTSANLELLNRYRHRIVKLSISLIGTGASEIKELMGISFDKVLRNVDELSANWPHLRELTRVLLRVTKGTPDERVELEQLQQKMQLKGIRVKAIKENWLTNRISVKQFQPQHSPLLLEVQEQSESKYVIGCGWSEHLLERLEVMVDGSVVLCCDDAEKHKVLGNVFEGGIEGVWMNALRLNHNLIMSNVFSNEKNTLPCARCTRAIWSDGRAANPDFVHHSTLRASSLSNLATASAEQQAYNLRLKNNMLQQTVHRLSVRLREQKDND